MGTSAPPPPTNNHLQVRSQYSNVHVFTVSPMRALKKHILVCVTRALALTTQYLLQRRHKLDLLLAYPHYLAQAELQGRPFSCEIFATQSSADRKQT